MRQRIEELFRRWGRFTYRHAWWMIAASLACAVAIGSQLPELRIDTSTESFLKPDDPARAAYDRFREQFGRDDQIVVAIETDDVFDADFLERLRAMHRDIEDEVPLIEEVSSLVNARDTRGVPDGLVVGELLDPWPETQAELDEVERLARSNPMYANLLLSRDGRFATILVRTSAYSALGATGDALEGFDDAVPGEDTAPRPFITGEENSAVVEALDAKRERYDGEGFRVYMAGSPIMTEVMQKVMTRDMARFTTLSFLIIIGLLAMLFRRVAGVVLPVVTVALSVIVTLGIMAISGTPLSLPTQILPSFLLAVGVGYSVHLMAIFLQETHRGASREDALANSLGHCGLAILMTGLTTAGGLASFSAAELLQIAQFGIFAPVGVLVALLFTTVLMPGLIAVFPMRVEAAPVTAPRDRLSQRLLVRAGEFANAHAAAIVLATAGLVAIAFLGALQISFAHDPIEWFQEDDYFRIANDVINDELEGSMFMEVLVDSHEENGLHDPELLDELDLLRQRASRYRFGEVAVGKVVSIVDVVKETHQALNENRPALYTIPDDRQLVAQELLLFENAGSDDLEELVDSRFSQARMTLKVSMANASEYEGFLRHMEDLYREVLGDRADFTFTGLIVLVGRTINAVTTSMARTYVLALAIITPLMIALIGRFRIGVLAMVPNLVPIIFTLGLMGWTGIPLDAFTLLVGSIAIGLAVDDTIHFMHHFRKNFDATGEVDTSIRETLRTTGQALLFTSLVLSAGFFIYMFASMNNLFYFGFLTGLTIILAFLADLILAPALITLVARPSLLADSRSQKVEATT